MNRFLLLAFPALLALTAASAASSTRLTAGVKISSATNVRPGDYDLNDPGGGSVQVSGSGFTVDFKGAKIVGDAKGVGLHLTGANNVVIKNAVITGCRWGVLLERCDGVQLLDCNVSWNGDLPPGTVIDESGREPEDQHGGGILLRDSHDCKVVRCTAQHQWDGIDVVRSDRNVIEDGDYSYNNNWGVHLWQASHNTFRRNRAVWCTTGEGMLFQALTGWQTYDAQAVGIDHASCDNVIEENDLRFGGDAIFIRANEGGETPGTAVPPKHSSDRNILRNNDCSFSPNNAIEVDFVADTVIEGNNCSYSNYGMWLGYSRGSRVTRNICVNDSTRAVEIENGQNATFKGNIFGWETHRRQGFLVYLRQNGRDRTPSGPYLFQDNAFYGAATAVQLLKTRGVKLAGNLLQAGAINSMKDVAVDPDSEVVSSTSRPKPPMVAPELFLKKDTPFHAGSVITLRGKDLSKPDFTPNVTVGGFPVWLKSVSPTEIKFWMPTDMWDRIQPDTAELRLFNGQDWALPIRVRLIWPKDQPRVQDLYPNPAKPGETITLTGDNLAGGKLYLNGKPIETLTSDAAKITFKAPQGMLTPVRYNVVVRRGNGLGSVQSPPISFSVLLTPAQLPHLVSATFTPQTLKVAGVVRVDLTVKNNLPYPARLQTNPKPPATYAENQAAQDMGIEEIPGALHLRVTSNHTAPHNPGSWPYMFGFDKPELAPGETTTVTGYIRVNGPGPREFRCGLVAGGFHFIDDNAFRTTVNVLP